MAFPDERFASLDWPLRLAPGERFEERFDFEVPRTLPVGTALVLRASLGERTLGARWLGPEHLVSVEVDAGRSVLRVGDRLNLSVSVSNRSKRVVDGVSLSVEVPHAFSVEEPGRTIGRLQPEESRRVDVAVRVVAPIEAATIAVSVESADGGWARAHVPVRVADPRGPDVRRGVASGE